MRCARAAESRRGREADDAFLEQHVESAVGSGDNVTDAAEILEDDLLGDGTTLTELTAKEGMEQPIAYWVPSIATCGINFYTGDLFPKWKNQLFLASLAAEQLLRLEIVDGKVVAQEVIFKDLSRIRHVITGPDGALYVLLQKRIVRLTPSS